MTVAAISRFLIIKSSSHVPESPVFPQCLNFFCTLSSWRRLKQCIQCCDCCCTLKASKSLHLFHVIFSSWEKFKVQGDSVFVVLIQVIKNIEYLFRKRIQSEPENRTRLCILVANQNNCHSGPSTDRQQSLGMVSPTSFFFRLSPGSPNMEPAKMNFRSSVT